MQIMMQKEIRNRAMLMNQLRVSDLSSFTAFDSVTTSTVQGWVESAFT